MLPTTVLPLQVFVHRNDASSAAWVHLSRPPCRVTRIRPVMTVCAGAGAPAKRQRGRRHPSGEGAVCRAAARTGLLAAGRRPLPVRSLSASRRRYPLPLAFSACICSAGTASLWTLQRRKPADLLAGPQSRLSQSWQAVAAPSVAVILHSALPAATGILMMMRSRSFHQLVHNSQWDASCR